MRQAGALEVLGEDLATGLLGVLAALALEPGADLRLRARGLRERQPVARRAALLLRGEHLADVARLERVVQRHDLVVDLRAYAAVADVGVDLVGEVERRRAGGQRLDLALRGEDEDLLVEEVHLQALADLLRALQLFLPVEQRLDPLDAVGALAGLPLV